MNKEVGNRAHEKCHTQAPDELVGILCISENQIRFVRFAHGNSLVLMLLKKINPSIPHNFTLDI